MIRLGALVIFVGLVAFPSRNAQVPNLSGVWRLVSATINMSRDGSTGERVTKTYLADGHAFNCGRGCRIVYTNSTLTIDNAQLQDVPRTSTPTVTIVIDGKPHKVVDSISSSAKTIDTVAQWDAGKLLITSMNGEVPLQQTLALEQGQLVMVKSYVNYPGAKFTLRYTRN